MLPIVDKPAIQYVVEEAVRSGLPDVLMVTGRSKRPLEDHFDAVPELEDALRSKGDLERLESVQESTDLANVHFVRQGEPKGLGHAVLCAKQHVGNETFAVLLGDDLIDERDAILPAMMQVAQRTGGSVVALLEVEPQHISMYGSAAVRAASGEISADLPHGVLPDDVVQVTDLVEKPAVESAPSNLAIIGRYVLQPAVFEVLQHTAPGRGGEIQVTDALKTLASMPGSAGGGVYGIVVRGRRYDTGDRLDYLKAVVRIAVDRPDLGAEFKTWLGEFLAEQQP